MNIAQPIGAQIESVDFGFYTEDEIRRISVKEITNPVLLDSLGHPTAGGLCATCKLDDRYCPGHFGHITLPIPAFHPLFFSHMYHLLRSTCLYCHHFKLARPEVHRFACILRLLDAGCMLDCHQIDQIQINSTGNKDGQNDEDSDEEEDNDVLAKDVQDLMRKRDAFVSECIKHSEPSRDQSKNSAVFDFKRRVIKEFLRTLVSRRKCDNCQAISPTFRKDGYATIFENPLPVNHQNLMENLGKIRPNVLIQRKNGDGQGSLEGLEEEGDYEEDDVNGISTFDDTVMGKKGVKQTKNSRVLSTTEVRNHLRRLFRNEKRMSALLYGTKKGDIYSSSADIFFIHLLPVTPTRFRPPSKMGDEVHENIQNDLLGKILSTSNQIRSLTSQTLGSKETAADKDAEAMRLRASQLLVSSFTQLQHDVNSFIDSNRNPVSLPQGKEHPPGIKQILEKKEGLFRKHMMGKRVNFAARSVISPDPYIETHEIGVPPVFATKLTYPEPVTPYNVQELRRAVINGAAKWPGATHVQNEDGSAISLLPLTLEQRTALANQLLTPQGSRIPHASLSRIGNTNKKVYRHLINGDMLILNRQPTLHKPSMMAHKARILPGEKTIRMHYANCNSYNADFDGDEMNMHFPQNEAARAESLLLANTNSQYLVATSGDPLRGLIQDHVVSGVWMTNKDTFFERQEYQQLVYTALRFEDSSISRQRILSMKPAIVKPRPLWTGKQVISTILLNLRPRQSDGEDYPGINLKSSSKVPGRYWGNAGKEENNVVVFDGELVCGVLDKSQFGASSYGLVHAVYELWGASCAGSLLSIFGRLFTRFLQIRGFTCRMDDLRLSSSGDIKRSDMLASGDNYGLEASREYVGLKPGSSESEMVERLEEVLRDNEKLAGLDAAMKGKLAPLRTSILNDCLPDGLLRQFPENHMQAMTVSGAKGSNVNVSQISCLLGQQELEGRRVPLMVSGKTLPSFKAFDTSARAGGFISGRFLTGIRPQEYYFHCMAGREGLIDTAVKTSRSGYLQRCLIKHLEGIKVHYDQTVRDSDNSVVQFNYGDDSLDVTKQKYLRKFGFSVANNQAFVQKLRVGEVVNMIDTDTAAESAKKAMKKPHKYDPVLSKFNPSRYLGSVSESFMSDLDKYSEQNPDKLIASKKFKPNPFYEKLSMTTKDFRSLMQLQYQQSLVQPGEMVGILASQSVGEPSTQMTLNTFHFAGFGAKNVTLGIPRLREIVMTASANIQTPSMTLPVADSTSNERAELFCKEISKLTLSEIVEHTEVVEKVQGYGSDEQTKIYSISVKLFSVKEYQDEYNLSPQNVVKAVSSIFIRHLLKVINAELKKSSAKIGKKAENSSTESGDIGKAVRPLEKQAASKANEEDLDVGQGDDDGNDGDATDQKMANKAKHFSTYDAPDEDDRNVVGNRGLDAESDDEDLGDGDESSESESEDDFEQYQKERAQSKEQKLRDEVYADRLATIKENFENVRDFKFDDATGDEFSIDLEFPLETPKLLMVSLVERACRLTVIQELSGIKRAFMLPPASELDQSRNLSTEGVNFKGLWQYDDIIKTDTLYSNDIAAILRTYGVEAARVSIVREISAVFAVYGIGVDQRHLSLIADYMTFEGGYKAFNRLGLESSASPFAKMSFETTCHFLTQATLYGDKDELHNPSASLVMGKVAELGTGSFEVHTPWE